MRPYNQVVAFESEQEIRQIRSGDGNRAGGAQTRHERRVASRRGRIPKAERAGGAHGSRDFDRILDRERNAREQARGRVSLRVPRSASTSTTAFRLGFTCSMRLRCASTNSADDIFAFRISRACAMPDSARTSFIVV